MGLSASIDLVLNKKLDNVFFKNILFDKEWSYNDNEVINYIPINELDFDWTTKPVNLLESVLGEIIEKLKLKQTLGVVIVHKNLNIGGQLIYFYDDNTVSFNLNINRKTLKDSSNTDFKWYVKNYVSLFENYEITSINCIEI